MKKIIFILMFLFSSLQGPIVQAASNQEVTDAIQLIFINRNKAILNKDVELLQGIYDTDKKYGTWAYEYDIRKMKYIHNWQEKQGARFTSINPKIFIKRITEKENKYSVNLVCSTEYKYVYSDDSEKENVCTIGTYHNIELSQNNNEWIVLKEWYKDPFGDSLNLDNIKVDSIKKYILKSVPKDISNLNNRRLSALNYAEKYLGAASNEKFGYTYNKNYRNYNYQGGDCANFASQILFEGGNFKKNGSWNYDKNGATSSWLNADDFKKYMLNSGRGSLIAYGNYESILKSSFTLLPGDFIAYEKKGDITHISVVTGIDSKGYALVSCHTSDRNNVPWDLGWSNKSIKFYLVRVNY